MKMLYFKLKQSATKSERKRNSAQKSSSKKRSVSSAAAASADVLRVRRPLMQDSDADGDEATSLQHGMASSEQPLQLSCDDATPSVSDTDVHTTAPGQSV